MAEISRIMADTGLAVILAPQTHAIHMAPHDYFRFTRYGLAALATDAGLEVLQIRAVSGWAGVVAGVLERNTVPSHSSGLLRRAIHMLLFGPARLMDLADVERHDTNGYYMLLRKRRSG